MRIGTRFTVLSASVTTLAAVIAIGTVLVSEFSHQKALMRADLESRVAQGIDWAAALRFGQRAELTAELQLLMLNQPALEGAAATDTQGQTVAAVGEGAMQLPNMRASDANDPLTTVTASALPTHVSTDTFLARAGLAKRLLISVPVLSVVNPLATFSDPAAYRLAAAENASGARFVVGYVQVHAPMTQLWKLLIPRAQSLLIAALVLIIIAFFYIRSTVRRISKPMEQLAATADDISSGKVPRAINIKKHQNDEIGHIATVLNGVIDGLHKMTAQLNVDRELMSLKVDSTQKQLSAAEAQVNLTRNRLKRVAYYDPVTSLPNRRLMLEQLDMLIRIAQRESRHLGVLVFNVENLRKINESLGRNAGDTMLRTVAQRLHDALRKSDVVGLDRRSGDSNDVSRIGNNEFCVLLHGLARSEDALQAATRIHESLAARIDLPGAQVSPVLRVGVAVAPEHGERSESILRAADIAANAASKVNTDAPLLFTPELDAAGSERFQIESDLLRARFDQEFRLHYQPQIDTSSGELVGAEALIRWQHPTLGNLPPFKFIPVAEESGVIIDLGAWIIRRACQDLRGFRDQGLALPKVSINISALQLTDELVDIVQGALEENQLDPSEVQLELTESLLVQDVDAVLQKLTRLSRDVGVRLSVDDFGTGYSSLAYLARFPLDELKVDRSFVIGMETDDSTAKVTSAIIAMARQLDLDIVVEGVDNPAQLTRLREFGASVIQGFLFSRPLPVDEFASYAQSKDWQGMDPSAESPTE